MSGTISVKLITSANPDGEVLTTENAATKIAASTNDATTIIEATFTGTGELAVGTINSSFDDYSMNVTSIGNRTLKVKVVNYNGIFNAFSTMEENEKLNIVDLSGMVQNNNLGEGQTQGLDGFAFSGCTNLREITLFPNCEEIETNAFSDCGNLLKIYEIPSGMTAVTSGPNTIFGGNENANTIAIFDIALSITGRGKVGSTNASAATISYSPVSAPAPDIIVQTYNVTATAILIGQTDHQASIIFSETVNSKPVITSSAFNVAENQTTVGTVRATDADGNTSFTYSITGGADAGSFNIDSSSGDLSFITAPDFDTPGSAATPPSNSYIVTVGVNDGTTTVTKNITVNVTNVNESPTFSSSTRTINVVENETTVGTVTATDPDSGTTLTYSITGGADQDAFNIDSSSGELTFVTAPNFESPGSAATPPSNSYIVIVTASNETNSATQTITVNVTNLNESPTFSSSTRTINVVENETTVGTVRATDPDSGTTLTYSITDGADQDAFNIDQSSGELTFVTAPNYETKSSYTVIVTASDETNSATQTITVNVTNVNETPTFSSSTRIINVVENETTVGTVTATDPDSGTTLTYSITGGADQDAFNIDSSSGELTFVTAPNFESPGSAATPPSNSYIVIVTASDETNSATQTITVNVTNVNETPTIDYEEFILVNPFQGTAEELETNQLKVVVTNNGDASSFSYQWQKFSDNGGNWTNIDGAATYTFTTDDVGKSFRAVVEFEYTDETTGSKELDPITYNAPPTWREVSDDKKTATVGVDYSYRPFADVGASEIYYLLESPNWLGFSSKTADNSNSIPYSDSSLLVGKPEVAGTYDVKIAVVDGGEIYRASVLEFKIIVSGALTPPTIDYEEFILANPFQGTAEELETNQLKVVVTNNGDASSFSYQWQKFSDNGGNWTNIDGAATYTFTTDDVGKSFRAVVEFEYTDETTGSKELDPITYNAPPTWREVSDDKKTATVGVDYSYRPFADVGASEIYYLLESPNWLGFSSKTGDNSNSIPYSDSSLLVGRPEVAGTYDVKIAVVDDGEIYRASVLEFKITVPFKTKTALQTAIDKWYELANGSQVTTSSTTTSSTSQTSRTNSYKINATGEVGEKTKFYINDINSNPEEIYIDGELTSDSYLIEGNGITKSNIVKVEIGTKVTSIGGLAFYQCRSLQSVTIGDSVMYMLQRAFDGCSLLESVTFDGTSQVIGIPRAAFYDCSALKSVTIPDNVTNIDDYAFSKCSALQSVTIPTNVNFTTIGDMAFSGCNVLQSLTIPDSADSIKDSAFLDSGLTTLYTSETNGLGLSEGSQTVGRKTVNVIFFSKDAANNYEGPEYFGNPNAWDVSLISDLDFLFYGKTQENHPDISTWNVFDVNTMQGTFSNSTFNGQLNNWNVENTTDFSYCFANNVVFNQELFRWNTHNAETLKYMFYNAWSFNQTINRAVQYNDTTEKFPTYPFPQSGPKIDWTEDTINNYLSTTYGKVTPQTNPTEFKGTFGMMTLAAKLIVKHTLVNTSLNNAQGKLVTLCNEIKLYNENYNSQNERWNKKDSSAYADELNGKTGDKAQLTQHKLNRTRVNTIIDCLLQIKIANDYIQNVEDGKIDNEDKVISQNLYTNIRKSIPFYLAWHIPKVESMAHMKHNAITFINGNTGTINAKVSQEINKKPVQKLLPSYNDKNTENIENLGEKLDEIVDNMMD